MFGLQLNNGAHEEVGVAYEEAGVRARGEACGCVREEAGGNVEAAE